jgi:hypothetical protein
MGGSVTLRRLLPALLPCWAAPSTAAAAHGADQGKQTRSPGGSVGELFPGRGTPS